MENQKVNQEATQEVKQEVKPEVSQKDNLFTIKDLYGFFDKNEIVDVTKPYDPLHFWEDFGDKYYKGIKKPAEVTKYVPYLVSRMKSLKVDSLYDAGCGFARLVPFLLDAECVKNVTCVDISQKQLDSAKDYLKDYKHMDKITFKKQSIKWSNDPGYSYDCTMSVECMQHLRLPTVRYAIKQLHKLSRKYVVIIERFVFDGEHPFPHLWSHNYFKLASDIGLKILEAKFIDNGVIAMVFKK